MNLLPTSQYAHALKSALPADAFAPSRSRLLWLPVHLAVIAACTLAIASTRTPWAVMPLLSLVIGASFAGLTFLAHETLHGAVVRSSRLRYLVGYVAFLPFVLSPRLWIAWHNRVHHGNANTDRPGVDPDANPTLAEHRGSRGVRIITDHFTLGGHTWSGPVGLMVGFTGQSGQVLKSAARRGILSASQHRLALAETFLGATFWLSLAAALGPVRFLFAFVIPLVVANTVVMAFIMTNHGLSPLSAVNDPLFNTLSVTTPAWVEWVTLGFGYHVEHHLFPSMSSRHAPAVRTLLLERWPERYQAMPLATALLQLHRTARVYENDTTLIDPRAGSTWPTLLPRPLAVLGTPSERRAKWELGSVLSEAHDDAVWNAALVAAASASSAPVPPTAARLC